MKQIKIKLNKYQRLLWKYANLYPDHFYNLGLSFRFTETLDPILLQDSFYYLVNSVDILHSLLIEDKNDLYFETQNDLPFEFSIEEIASEKLCEIALDRFTQSIFDLYTQRPIRAKLYKLPNHSYVLVIVFHHICIDGTSVTDLLNLLAQISNKSAYKTILIPNYNYPRSGNMINSYKRAINTLIRNIFRTLERISSKTNN